MDRCEHYSPFVLVSDSTQQLLSEVGHQRDGLLDHLGKSTAGELYWNGEMHGMGLVCGSSMPRVRHLADLELHESETDKSSQNNEMATIIRRLIASHMKAPESQVLILHTDHLSITRDPCSLLDSMGPRPLVLVSPHSVTGVVEKYTSQGIRVAPIISKETSISLRHVLALFTPPSGMKGASSILCTIQLILSQISEPFDLQRFIELIDQEKWSEDGVNFMALRQTLLMKLLSPQVGDAHQDKPRQVVLVDLTDPILWNTGLDSSIMDIALYDFIHSSGGRKLIVLNNCQQYLTHSSNLTRSLEAIAALGDDRPTGIIFSTTDPTVVSSSLLNLVDYVIVGSTRSLQWSNSLRQHFAGIDISKGQLRCGRAMVWSPESTSLVQNASGTASQQRWKDDPAFIDIEQLKQSMPVTQVDASPDGIHSDDYVPNGPEEKTNRSPVTRQEVISVETSHERERTGGREDDEEKVISLDELRYPFMNGHPSSSGPLASGNEEHAAFLLTQQTSAVASLPGSTNQSDIATRFTPLVSIISMLGDGKPGTLVDYKAVKTGMKSRKKEVKELGWSSARLGPMLTAACQERVVESIEVNRCIKFLTLLPTSLDSETYTAHPVAPEDEDEDKVLIGENNTHVAASHPEPIMVASSSDTPSKVRRAGAPHAGSEDDSLPRPTDHYPDKYVPLIAAVLKLSDGRTDYKVTLEALRGELRGVLVSETMRANAWLNIEQWVNQACLEHYLQRGRMARCAWVMVPATNEGRALFENDLPPIAVALPAPDTVSSETNQSTLTMVLPTIVPSQQAGQIETPSTLAQSQTIARLEPLIACISRLGGNQFDSQVSYAIVKQEMNSRKPEIESLGWPNFGMIMEAAYKEKVVEPIRKKRNGKIKFLRLIPQSPRSLPLPQVEPTEYSMGPTMPCITSIAPEAGHPVGTLAKAMNYPLEHRPVVLTMLRLINVLGIVSMAPGAGVPMVELAKALGRDYPCREGDCYLIARAKEDGIISMGENSDSWAYLNSPPIHTTPLSTSSPMSPATPPRIPAQNPTLQLTSTTTETEHCAFEHPLVTSAILELTGGAWDIKVRLVDLMASLLRNCSGAEGMVLPLLFQAKHDGLIVDETDADGMIWVRLRSPPHTDFTAMSNHIPSPPPEPAYPIPTLIPNTALLGGLGLVTGVLKSPTSEPIQLPTRALSGQTTSTDATALASASQAPTKRFIVDIIPYGEIGHLANPMRKDVKENSPRKTKPSGAEAQEHDPHISPKAVEKEVDSRTRQGRRPSLGMLTDAAFELMVVEPRVPPPSTPPHAPQAIPKQFSAHMRSELLIAMDEDKPVPPPSPPPVARVNTSTPPPPPLFSSVEAKKIPAISRPRRYGAAAASLITLTDGTPGKKVRMDNLMSSLRCDYPGAREAFLLALIAIAEECGVVTRERSHDGVQWAWLNPEEDV